MRPALLAQRIASVVVALPCRICPTANPSKLTKGPADQDRLISGMPDQYKLGIPLGKLATPNDIADVVLYLASDQAGHITMQDVVVDAGATLAA